MLPSSPTLIRTGGRSFLGDQPVLVKVIVGAEEMSLKINLHIDKPQVIYRYGRPARLVAVCGIEAGTTWMDKAAFASRPFHQPKNN
jgi:hypothetical protein